MLILRQGKLINIDISEDSMYNSPIIATKTKEQLRDDVKNLSEACVNAIVAGKEYTLKCIEDYGKGQYVFRCTKSEYADESSLGNGFAVYRFKGEAIKRMLDAGYTVMQSGKLITL